MVEMTFLFAYDFVFVWVCGIVTTMVILGMSFHNILNYDAYIFCTFEYFMTFEGDILKPGIVW